VIERVRQRYDNVEVAVAIDDRPDLGLRPHLWPSVGEYPCYDPSLYHLMSTDTVRNSAFRGALRPLVKGRTVLDLGTGQDLNWALEAARGGASRVFAVEEIEESYRMAVRRLATAREAPTIELVYGRSFDLRVPRRAEVCVAELVGTIASAEGILAVMADARERLLAPGAVVVPSACRTMVGAMSLRSLFPAGPALSRDGLPYLPQIFQRYRRAFDIRLALANPPPDCIVSTTEPIETLTFDGTEPLDATTSLRLRVRRAGEIDGLLLWIRLTAGGNTRVVDSLTDRTSWIPVYLPMFDVPVAVSGGETMEVVFERRTSDDGIHPDYAVEVALTTASGIVAGFFRSSHHGTEVGTSAIYRDLWGLV
jgi:type I protein arginine methyltransferase